MKITSAISTEPLAAFRKARTAAITAVVDELAALTKHGTDIDKAERLGNILLHELFAWGEGPWHGADPISAPEAYRKAAKDMLDTWVPACGGTEQPFMIGDSHFIYVYNFALNQHSYLNLDQDLLVDQLPER